MVDDEQDESDNVDEEGEDDSDEDSDDASVEDVKMESDDMECEIDEEFRKEIKLALGDAALPSSEVCHLCYDILCEDTNTCVHVQDSPVSSSHIKIHC